MGIQKISNNFQKTIVLILEIILLVGIFYIFFGLFYIDSPQIMRPSRTSAITMTTFIAVGISLFIAYGGYAVGKKKSKEIVMSIFIGVLLTDLITYVEFTIMNVNKYNNMTIDFSNIGILFITILFQLIFIYLMVYFGNFIYFKINPPARSVIILNNIDNANEYLRKINKYKKQYVVSYVITAEDAYECRKHIRITDSVFLFDIPLPLKTDLIEYAYKHQKQVYYTLDLAEVVVNQSKHVLLDDTSVLHSTFKGMTLEQKFMKRLLDLLVSSVGLIVLSPIIILESIAIKLYDKGPIFYKQERLTIDGRIFEVLKFRTMIQDAEKGKAVLSSKNDSRVTPVGKFLRATRLDEIPQLINVFLGQMSIVGPRPERRSIATEYTKDIPEFKFRLRTKAGLTGLAQIRGKYNTTPKDKLILDLMYIEGYSIWKDILLMLQTVLIFFKTESTEGFDEGQHIEFEMINKISNEDETIVKVYKPKKDDKKPK